LEHKDINISAEKTSELISDELQNHNRDLSVEH